MESKYNKILKIIIIVVAVLVVALFAALGYSIYKRYYAAREQANATQNADDYISRRRRTTNDIDGLNVDTESEAAASGLKRPTYAGYTVAGYLKIDSIRLETPVLLRYSESAIEKAPCQIGGVDLINVPGRNAMIEGHNFRNGTQFSNLSNVQIGDIIYVTDTRPDSCVRVKYEVYNIYETAAEDKEEALYRKIPYGKREITLSTCYGDNNESRTIVWARDVEEPEENQEEQTEQENNQE